MPGVSLAVQSVVYNNDIRELRSAIQAASQACLTAVNRGIVSTWEIFYGDASPIPLLPEPLINEFTKVVGSKGGTFKYVFFDRNTGHGGGHNLLSELSASEFIVILNPDGRLAPDSIAESVNQFSENVGLCDGRQIPLEHLKEYNPQTRDTDWCSGAFMTIRRNVFEELEGFDHETFFMYCDDVDLSWRARLLGWRTVHAPQARVFHDKRIDLKSNIEASSSELFFSKEAAFLLPYKFSRPDLANKVLTSLSESKDPVSLQVANVLNARISGNRLPNPIDKKHKVGTFVNGGYSHMRSKESRGK